MTVAQAAIALRTADGRPVALGPRIAAGGQGAIHEVVGAPALVAKLYLQPPDPTLAAKLRALIDLPPERRPVPVVWPHALLFDGSGVAGFLMPRITGRRDLHALSAPTSRRKHFPTADYRSLVVTAANLARGVAAIHAAGHVIGDINDRFAMVDERATVALIDADSFQVDVNGVRHTCDVAQSLYQPPELQAAPSYRGLARTRNHDAFGLAVLIFQLLFLHRHPFQGVPLSGDVPEIHAAIARHQFAFSSAALQRGLKAPPNALPLAAVGATLGGYFERAFGPEGHMTQGTATGRPSAAAWVAALDGLAAQLRRCTVNDGHWHLGSACALCTLEGGIGTLLFLPRAGGIGLADINEQARRLWQQISAVLPPVPWGDPPSHVQAALGVVGVPYPPRRRPSGLWQRMGSALGMWSDPLVVSELDRRRRILAEAKAEQAAAIAAWRKADDGRAAFARARAELEQAYEGIQAQPKVRATMLASLQTHAKQHQLRSHLSDYEIGDAKLRGIGRSLVMTLEGAGFETAADCDNNALNKAYHARLIPGIGPAKIATLVAWRQDLEGQFRFNANRLVLPHDVVQLDLEFARAGKRMVVKLQQGIVPLRHIASDADRRLQEWTIRLRAHARAVAQAEADVAMPLPG